MDDPEGNDRVGDQPAVVDRPDEQEVKSEGQVLRSVRHFDVPDIGSGERRGIVESERVARDGAAIGFGGSGPGEGDQLTLEDLEFSAIEIHGSRRTGERNGQNAGGWAELGPRTLERHGEVADVAHEREVLLAGTRLVHRTNGEDVLAGRGVPHPEPEPRIPVHFQFRGAHESHAQVESLV
jgi:hypothetical protein